MKSLLLAFLVVCISGLAVAAEPQSSELPPAIQAFAAQGFSIDKSMPAPPGFKGYVGQYNGQKIPVYLLPDGQHVVIGSIYDANGNNLTMASFRKASTPVFGAAEWQQLKQATWLAEGATDPERIVYVFTDTECPYCNRLWQQSRALLVGSDTQIRHIIVAVISPTKSAPRAAAILGADDPAAAFQKHESNFGHSPFPADQPVPAEIEKALRANGELMNKLGAFGTPAMFYHDADGKVRLQAGVPDAASLRKIILGP